MYTFFPFVPRRDNDLTLGAVRTAEPSIQHQQWTASLLSQGHVPSIVTGQVATQCPYALGKRREGE